MEFHEYSIREAYISFKIRKYYVILMFLRDRSKRGKHNKALAISAPIEQDPLFPPCHQNTIVPYLPTLGRFPGATY